MPEREELAEEIKRTGFHCTMCAECCLRQSEDSNLVLLSAPEIREIISATGMHWADIAEPYPETFEKEECKVTFAWCLRRKKNRCIFLGDDNRCKIYKNRPLICRTYPFMLVDGRLTVSECRAVAKSVMSKDEALMLADELIEREKREDMEYEKIRRIYGEADLSGFKFCVIDSEGVKKIG